MTTRIYPTHLRSAGPIRTAVPDPESPGNSVEIVIGDEGADVDDALAEQLIRFRDATTLPASELEAVEPDPEPVDEAPADELPAPADGEAPADEIPADAAPADGDAPATDETEAKAPEPTE